MLTTAAAYFCLPAATLAFALFQSAVTGAPDWAGLGIGGILAGVMFWFYRQDRLASEARAAEATKALIENTKALTELNTMLRANEK
jgi:hypothetical protein